MSALASDVIAWRAGILWVVGLCTIAGISGYTAVNFRGRPAPVWKLIGPIMAARICLLLGPAGAGLLAGRMMREQGDGIAGLIVVATIVVLYWASLMAVQFAQNFVYRLVGAPIQRIRWWNEKPKRKRWKAKASAAGS